MLYIYTKFLVPVLLYIYIYIYLLFFCQCCSHHCTCFMLIVGAMLIVNWLWYQYVFVVKVMMIVDHVLKKYGLTVGPRHLNCCAAKSCVNVVLWWLLMKIACVCVFRTCASWWTLTSRSGWLAWRRWPEPLALSFWRLSLLRTHPSSPLLVAFVFMCLSSPLTVLSSLLQVLAFLLFSCICPCLLLSYPLLCQLLCSYFQVPLLTSYFPISFLSVTLLLFSYACHYLYPCTLPLLPTFFFLTWAQSNQEMDWSLFSALCVILSGWLGSKH